MPQGAEWKRDALAKLAVRDPYQFKAAAAQIADVTVCVRVIAEDAEACCARFGIAVEHIDADAKRGSTFNQLVAVPCLARRSGRDHAQGIDLHRARERFKPRQCRQRLLHRRIVDDAVTRQTSTQGNAAFFIINRHRRARQAGVDDKTDGVGADIDYGLTNRFHRRLMRLSFGTFLSSVNASPRPDSEALVMK